MYKIAGVVVLYNPEQAVITNIESYINDIDILYVVDNSDQKQSNIIDALLKNSKIEYINSNGNQGIAHALNIGANKAIEMDYEWLLTMDQDSSAHSYMLSEMLKYIDNDISIITPFHANAYHQYSSSSETSSFILTTMTSGNLLNLSVYANLKGFKEEFFIDYVDNEYCLQSHLNNYKIIQVNHAILNHNLGDLKKHQFLWKYFFSTNHSPIRRYYITRNRFKIIELYQNHFSEYCDFEKSRFLVDFIIVLLYEKQKIAKFKMMLRGYLDYKRGIFGKCHD